MTDLWNKIEGLIIAGEVRISEHGYDALVDDRLTVDEVLSGAEAALVIEEYPDYPKGVSILVLQHALDVNLCTRFEAFRADTIDRRCW